MSVSSRAGVATSPLQSLLQNVPSLLLAPVPLAVLQPVFTRIAAHVAHSRPELFARLARISHTTECIGAANQRKPLCRNNSSSIAR